MLAGARRWFSSLSTWQKVAVVGGSVLGATLLLGGGAAAGVIVARQVRGLIQNDSRWGKQQLGGGTSTLGAGGCLLTAFTMVANALAGKNLLPPDTNAICRSAGCFVNNSSNLDAAKAAAALGLTMGTRIRNEPSRVDDMVAVARAVLAGRGLGILHVTHDNDVDGDHFIVVNGTTASGGFTAVDPVNGKTLTLDNRLCGASSWGRITKNYSPTGIMALFGPASFDYSKNTEHVS